MIAHRGATRVAHTSRATSRLRWSVRARTGSALGPLHCGSGTLHARGITCSRSVTGRPSLVSLPSPPRLRRRGSVATRVEFEFSTRRAVSGGIRRSAYGEPSRRARRLAGGPLGCGPPSVGPVAASTPSPHRAAGSPTPRRRGRFDAVAADRSPGAPGQSVGGVGSRSPLSHACLRLSARRTAAAG